jgi:hypothetical protein
MLHPYLFIQTGLPRSLSHSDISRMRVSPWSIRVRTGESRGQQYVAQVRGQFSWKLRFSIVIRYQAQHQAPLRHRTRFVSASYIDSTKRLDRREATYNSILAGQAAGNSSFAYL